jgi:hypothetical protein
LSYEDTFLLALRAANVGQYGAAEDNHTEEKANVPLYQVFSKGIFLAPQT